MPTPRPRKGNAPPRPRIDTRHRRAQGQPHEVPSGGPSRSSFAPVCRRGTRQRRRRRPDARRTRVHQPRRHGRDRTQRSCFRARAHTRRDARRCAAVRPRGTSSTVSIESRMVRSQVSTVGELRRAVESGTRPASHGSRRGPRKSHHPAARRRCRSSPASSATTTPSSRSWSTRCCRATTSSCSACAGRRKRGCCARWSRCSTITSRSCPAARSTTIR